MSVATEPRNTIKDFQEDLRRLVAGDEFREATDRLLTATSGAMYQAYHAEVILFSSQLNAHWQTEVRNTEDFGVLSRNRSKLCISLLELIDAFPTEADLSKANTVPAGVSERKLKRNVFWQLMLGKTVVLFFAWFQHDTGGGLSEEDLLVVIGILIPIFGTYLNLAFQDTAKHRHILKPDDVRVNKEFANRTYLVVMAYPLILCGILYLRAKGIMITSMAALTIALGLAESGWGVYVGKVVMGLFKDQP